MKVHRLLAALAPLVLITALATPAAAQSETVQAGVSPSATPEPGVWSVTPFLSITFGGGSDTASLGLGGAIGYDFTTNISFEAELGYVLDLAGDEEAVEWSTFGGAANVLYHFPLETITLVPYATGGVGVLRSSLNFHGEDQSATEIGFNLGGGVKVPMTDNIAVRGDIRFFQFPDSVPDGWRVYGGLTWRLRR